MNTFIVEDMSCAHCVSRISNKLKELNTEVKVDLETKSVTIADESLVAKAKELVIELGYTVE